MKIQIPYDYIILLAFETLFKFENKKSITIKTLEEYEQKLLEQVINDCNDKNIEFLSEEEQLEGKISFYKNNEDNIETFLGKYNKWFYKKDNSIYMKDIVTYEEIEKELGKLIDEDKISMRFASASHKESLLNVLSVNKINKLLSKYLVIEEKLEDKYMELSKGNDVKDDIKQLLMLRAIFLNNICQNPDYFVDAVRLISLELKKEFNYDKLPIDLKLWKNSEYYFDTSDDLMDIDDLIYDLYQYSIFGKDKTYSSKLREMLEEIYVPQILYTNSIDENNMFESSEDQKKLLKNMEDTFGIDEVELAFYMTYIHKLNNYMKENGNSTELLKSKYRLLYSIDMPQLSLYDDKKFKKHFNNLEDYELEAEDFDWFESEVRFMSDEIFQTKKDINTIKKLLFISTYYELTKDSEIKDIFEQYRNNENYGLYSEIVFGKKKGFSKRLNRK